MRKTETYYDSRGVGRRKLVFELTCYAPLGATISEVRNFIEGDLHWSGRCRDPHDDPMFDCLDKIKAVRKHKGAKET